jgi:uncharacterized membrane protein YjgN (DUF898 family)
MIVMVSIIALVLIVMSADTDGKIIKEISNGPADNQIVSLIIETYGLIILGMAIFVILFGYASIKLLGAANKFTAISYMSNRDDLTKAFKNLRLYWMYCGITFIVMIVLGIYFMIKAASVISELSQS